eukprot:52584_1
MSTEISVRDYVDLLIVSLCVILQSILCIWWILKVHCTMRISQDNIKDESSISPSGSNKSIPNLQIQTSTTSDITQHNNKIEQTMYNYTKKKKTTNEHKIHTPLKILTLSSLFCGLLATSSLCTNHILRLYNGFGTCMSHQIPVIFLLIQRCSLFLCYLYRLEITFKDSVFSINQYKVNIFKIATIVIAVIATTFHFVFAKLNRCTAISLLIGMIPAGINDTTVSITTFVLFVNRLKKLMKLGNGNENSNIKLKTVIQKLTILIFVTISSTIGLMAFFVIVPQVGVFSIDILVNSWCLLLSYKFFTGSYNKLCFVCIKCVQNISQLDKKNKSNNSDVSL